jgi:hypothetical protein
MVHGRMRVVWHYLIAGALTLGVTFCLNCNRAPGAPDTPNGPSSGKVDSLHAFTSIAADPDGGAVRYRFDWGDGDTSDWTDTVQSGKPGGASHSWHASGTFAVRAQAKDAREALSAWSDGHQIDVAVAWIRIFGGTKYKYAHSVQQTTDGGYIVAGHANSKLWLLKTDSCGGQVWEQTFGPPEGTVGYSVQQTTDGGYIMTGLTGSPGTDKGDVWLVKTDASGGLVWDKTFGGTERDEGNSVQQTSDGGYIIVGNTESYGAGDSDIWLVKTDASGNKAWDKTLGGAGIDHGNSVRQTTDGGYIIVGTSGTYEVNSSDVRLFKTDSAGNTTWNKTFGADSVWDEGNSVEQTTDGGYIVAGCSGPGLWLVKTDASGIRAWDKTIGGGMVLMEGNSIRQTTDAGYVVAGTSLVAGGTRDFELLRTDASGNKVWDRTFGTPNLEFGASVQPTTDGGYIMTGYSHPNGGGNTDAWLIKTGPTGE